MAENEPPNLKVPEVLKSPLLDLLKQLNAAEWTVLLGLFLGVGLLGYRLHPVLEPPKPCPDLTAPCPTSEAIDRDCRGLKENGGMKVNAQGCLRLATQAQVCGKPDLVLNLLDVSCRNGNGEACDEFKVIRPGPPPCDSGPQKASHSSRQTAPQQVPVPPSTPSTPVPLPPGSTSGKRRHLDDTEKRKLTAELAKWLGKKFDVLAPQGDGEAIAYAMEIFKWMKVAGYSMKNSDEIDTTSGGLLFGESVHLNNFDGIVWVEIGYQEEAKN